MGEGQLPIGRALLLRIDGYSWDSGICYGSLIMARQGAGICGKIGSSLLSSATTFGASAIVASLRWQPQQR